MYDYPLLFHVNGIYGIFSILDIEYEMTNFAYYYVGIGAAVFILGYFQVSEGSYVASGEHLTFTFLKCNCSLKQVLFFVSVD